MDIIISDKIREAAPAFRVITIEAEVSNSTTGDALWQLLLDEGERVRSAYAIDHINKRAAIKATREAYKVLGKEPNRYRPSAEALCRRLVKGMELYRINALVDIINLISVKSGYSIGGFDIDKIDGETLTLGVGRENEPFEGIGRGTLNIHHLPVYRDNTGGIGTPTSDNERTKLDLTTRHLLMTINIYGEEMEAEATVNLTKQLLSQFCNTKSFTVKTYSAN